jgi:hypothetical protein
VHVNFHPSRFQAAFYGTKEGFLKLYEELREDILQELRVTFKMPEEAVAWQKDVRARLARL